MAKIYNLEWDTEAQRTYETGVSTGVLYPTDADGNYGDAVAWNGLTSVSQSPEGAEANDIYADNIKYLSLVSAETFNATIEAYTYPDEFAACDGSIEIGGTAGAKTGIRIGQQKRSSFAFSYVTKKGDANNKEWDIIHIIYGCKAAPSERSYETVNDSPEAITFSWEINTTGTSYTDSATNTEYKGICHIEIDTSKYPSTNATAYANLKALKEYMYGVGATKGKCPMPNEVVSLLTTGTLPTTSTPEVQE